MREEFVELKVMNGLLKGMVHIPDIPDSGEKPPVVIMFHGFTGNRMEPSFMFVRFSRLLLEHGIASVRFDFWGSGESEGSFEKMTFSGELQDARDIFSYVSDGKSFDSDRIFLLGLSMGGSIASCLAGELGERVRGLILWSAAGEMKKLFLAHMEEIERKKREVGVKNINMDVNPLDSNGLLIGKEFVDDVMSVEIMKAASHYRGDVLILHGDEDPTVPLEVSYEYSRLFGERAEHHVIKGGDHTFRSHPCINEVFSLSLDFIEKRIK